MVFNELTVGLLIVYPWGPKYVNLIQKPKFCGILIVTSGNVLNIKVLTKQKIKLTNMNFEKIPVSTNTVSIPFKKPF